MLNCQVGCWNVCFFRFLPCQVASLDDYHIVKVIAGGEHHGGRVGVMSGGQPLLHALCDSSEILDCQHQCIYWTEVSLI